MKKAISAYLAMANHQLWMATDAILPSEQGMTPMGLKQGRFTILPLPSGLPQGGINDMSRSEATVALNRGFAYSGTVVVSLDEKTGAVALEGGFGMSEITAQTRSREDYEVLQGVARAGAWMARATGAAPRADESRLAHALEALLSASNALDEAQSVMVRDVMVGEGLADKMGAVTKAKVQAMDLLEGRSGGPLRHRIEDNQDEQSRAPDAPAGLDLSIEMTDTTVIITADEDRQIYLELEDGALRIDVHEARQGREAPVTLRVPREGDIRIEFEGYETALRFDEIPEIG